MKDWAIKADNTPTDASIYYSSDVNSKHNEYKNVVRPFTALHENDNKQLIKSISILTKSLSYLDTGTVNNVVLRRSSIAETVETYKGGMSIFFTPKYNNTTTSVTVRIYGLPAKNVVYRGNPIPAGFLLTDMRYVLYYDSANDRFSIANITPVTTNGVPVSDANSRFQLADGINTNEGVSVGQMNTKISKMDIEYTLTSYATDKPLAAIQGGVLKGLITQIQDVLHSPTTSLDTFQEIVDYIKANRNSLTGITISEVNGLQTALDYKSPTVHNHDSLYYTTSTWTTDINNKIAVAGDASAIFNVADGGTTNAVNHKQAIANPRKPSGWTYSSTVNPSTNTNPPYDWACWQNKATGEFFVCINRTPNGNVWKGTNGTTVS